MFAAINRFPLTRESGERFEAFAAENRSLMSPEDGCVGYQLLRPSAAGAAHVFVSFWESEATYDAFARSDAHLAAHDTLGPLEFAEPPTLERYEVALASP